LQEVLGTDGNKDSLLSQTTGDTAIRNAKNAVGEHAYVYGAHSAYWATADAVSAILTDDRASQTGGPGGIRAVPETRGCQADVSGTGASHAGRGGRPIRITSLNAACDAALDLEPAESVPSYGDVREPLALGSAGGSSFTTRVLASRAGLGGPGGGAIRIKASNSIDIDERTGAVVASANGLNGKGNSYTAGGGGSGGSVLMQAPIIIGTGTISVVGGSSDASNAYVGGGGSGGRVSLLAMRQLSRDIVANVYGGVPYSSDPSCIGAAGTIYREESQSGFASLDVKGSSRTYLPTVLPLGMSNLRLAYLNVTGGAVISPARSDRPGIATVSDASAGSAVAATHIEMSANSAIRPELEALADAGWGAPTRLLAGLTPYGGFHGIKE